MSGRGEAVLSRRLSLVFVVLLLMCCGTSTWLRLRSNGRHGQEVVQRLSSGLAAHIAENAELIRPEGLNPAAVKDLFDKLMTMNPNVEVYPLLPDGHIAAQAMPPGHLRRDHVDLAPARRLPIGATMSVLGDDPHNLQAPKVFSATPMRTDGRNAGYVYVVLQGESRDAVTTHVMVDNILRTTLWSMGLVALLRLVAGTVAS